MSLEEMDITIFVTGALQKEKGPANFFVKVKKPEEKLRILQFAIALKEQEKETTVAGLPS